MLDLLGAGLGLIGSLFGGKKNKTPEKTVTESYVDYGKMVREATAAGFNPLTVLRNGGSAGFASSTTTHPGLSSNADLGASLGQFGSALAGYFDPVAKKQRQVESALLDYQLGTIQKGGKPVRFGDVPTRRAAPAQYQAKGALSSGGNAAPSRVLSAATGLPGNGGWLSPPPSGGEAMPIWIKGVDRDGKEMWIPNPDGPDIEQLGFGVATRVQAGAEAYAKTLFDTIAEPSSAVKFRKLDAKEQREYDESWLPGWVPRGLKLSW